MAAARISGRIAARDARAARATAARPRAAAPTAKRNETPRSPTTLASWTNAGQGLTSPAGLQAKIVGSESAARTPEPKASSKGMRARRCRTTVTPAPTAQMIDCAAASRTSARIDAGVPRLVKRWMTAGTKRRPMMPADVPQTTPRPNARPNVGGSGQVSCRGPSTDAPTPSETARRARPATTAG